MNFHSRCTGGGLVSLVNLYIYDYYNGFIPWVRGSFKKKEKVRAWLNLDSVDGQFKAFLLFKTPYSFINDFYLLSEYQISRTNLT